MNSLCFLFPILAGLGGLLVGWLLRGVRIKELNQELSERNTQIEHLMAENTELNTKWKAADQLAMEKQRLYDDLYTDYGKLNIEQRRLLKEKEDLEAQMTTPSGTVQQSQQNTPIERTEPAESASTKVSEKSIDTGISSISGQTASTASPDDLTKIEGIGPKIQQLFNDAGIFTFAQLAGASVEQLTSILTAAGPRYQSHQPNTWPRQAAMARDGEWQALEKWQDELDGGKETI
ncbi:MAG: hypothetical protein KTR13_00200 [Saprospiraceae bacterium]|nr:hypothetical protein [Saprospiraceae bacterium]